MTHRALVILFLAACKTATPEPTPTTPVLDCTTVEPDSCTGTTGCSAIRGTFVGSLGGAVCLDPLASDEVIGCQSAEDACPAVEIVASSPDDAVYNIPAGCAPAGWTVQNLTVEECSPDCAAVALEDCTGTAGCALITGQQLVDADRDVCFDPFASPEPLACAPASSCDAAITRATEGLDTPVYQFSDSCIPAGWTTVSESFATCECASIPVDDCAANTACQLLSGRRLEAGPNGECVNYDLPLEPVVCAPTGACGDALSYATSPADDATWEFPDTCLPRGWDAVQGSYEACP